jgi:hypothetical protein
MSPNECTPRNWVSTDEASQLRDALDRANRDSNANHRQCDNTFGMGKKGWHACYDDATRRIQRFREQIENQRSQLESRFKQAMSQCETVARHNAEGLKQQKENEQIARENQRRQQLAQQENERRQQQALQDSERQQRLVESQRQQEEGQRRSQLAQHEQAKAHAERDRTRQQEEAARRSVSAQQEASREMNERQRQSIIIAQPDRESAYMNPSTRNEPRIVAPIEKAVSVTSAAFTPQDATSGVAAIKTMGEVYEFVKDPLAAAERKVEAFLKPITSPAETVAAAATVGGKKSLDAALNPTGNKDPAISATVTVVSEANKKVNEVRNLTGIPAETRVITEIQNTSIGAIGSVFNASSQQLNEALSSIDRLNEPASARNSTRANSTSSAGQLPKVVTSLDQLFVPTSQPSPVAPARIASSLDMLESDSPGTICREKEGTNKMDCLAAQCKISKFSNLNECKAPRL